jgi:uncharacterized protein YecA (UPF0149 family)
MGAIADALVDFAQPLLDQTDGSLEQVQRAFSLSQLCYNLALLPEESREKTLKEMQASLKMDDEEFDEFRRSFVNPMLRRHEKMFPRMHRRAFTETLEYRRSLETQSRTAAPGGRYTGTDRYAPCPCNSGRKYKFCCGLKSR